MGGGETERPGHCAKRIGLRGRFPVYPKSKFQRGVGSLMQDDSVEGSGVFHALKFKEVMIAYRRRRWTMHRVFSS